MGNKPSTERAATGRVASSDAAYSPRSSAQRGNGQSHSSDHLLPPGKSYNAVVVQPKMAAPQAPLSVVFEAQSGLHTGQGFSALHSPHASPDPTPSHQSGPLYSQQFQSHSNDDATPSRSSTTLVPSVHSLRTMSDKRGDITLLSARRSSAILADAQSKLNHSDDGERPGTSLSHRTADSKRQTSSDSSKRSKEAEVVDRVKRHGRHVSLEMEDVADKVAPLGATNEDEEAACPSKHTILIETATEYARPDGGRQSNSLNLPESTVMSSRTLSHNELSGLQSSTYTSTMLSSDDTLSIKATPSSNYKPMTTASMLGPLANGTPRYSYNPLPTSVLPHSNRGSGETPAVVAAAYSKYFDNNRFSPRNIAKQPTPTNAAVQRSNSELASNRNSGSQQMQISRRESLSVTDAVSQQAAAAAAAKRLSDNQQSPTVRSLQVVPSRGSGTAAKPSESNRGSLQNIRKQAQNLSIDIPRSPRQSDQSSDDGKSSAIAVPPSAIVNDADAEVAGTIRSALTTPQVDLLQPRRFSETDAVQPALNPAFIDPADIIARQPDGRQSRIGVRSTSSSKQRSRSVSVPQSQALRSPTRSPQPNRRLPPTSPLSQRSPRMSVLDSPQPSFPLERRNSFIQSPQSTAVHRLHSRADSFSLGGVRGAEHKLTIYWTEKLAQQPILIVSPEFAAVVGASEHVWNRYADGNTLSAERLYELTADTVQLYLLILHSRMQQLYASKKPAKVERLYATAVKRQLPGTDDVDRLQHCVKTFRQSLDADADGVITKRDFCAQWPDTLNALYDRQNQQTDTCTTM